MRYAGDATPKETYEALVTDTSAVLVDCRTSPEWAFVGTPRLDEIEKTVHLIEWQRFPDGVRNASFEAQLDQLGIDHEAPIYFLCRSGARSKAAAAAATSAGYRRAYNVSDGFEGPPDGSGQRGSVSGWKVEGLPWSQP